MNQKITNISMPWIYSSKRFHRQQGATLFTALVFLALMTIVSVSAAKISMLDVLIAGNNQQQMELYQRTTREIDQHATGQRLLRLFQDQESTRNTKVPWVYNYPAVRPNLTQRITNRSVDYSCEGLNKAATSQGAANTCRIFDFEVTTSQPSSSARDRHVRGAGKEYPSASRNNFNNR